MQLSCSSQTTTTNKKLWTRVRQPRRSRECELSLTWLRLALCVALDLRTKGMRRIRKGTRYAAPHIDRERATVSGEIHTSTSSHKENVTPPTIVCRQEVQLVTSQPFTRVDYDTVTAPCVARTSELSPRADGVTDSPHECKLQLKRLPCQPRFFTLAARQLSTREGERVRGGPAGRTGSLGNSLRSVIASCQSPRRKCCKCWYSAALYH